MQADSPVGAQPIDFDGPDGVIGPHLQQLLGGGTGQLGAAAVRGDHARIDLSAIDHGANGSDGLAPER